ncbi:N-acetylmuramoyl-L-alanine amidase family protein [Paenibacillus sp. MMS20-IR301]|uniref:N-acetylmuramoyl-L-alanine amidase family protein n=1 Tax=Paenibacillus sp. MMS20-IR301 TaxID=2895946 RepID=UPI0028E60344|nr:N-acetylmuramoyl-L-alanine amidase family protein [Paenibacillus sp. MMS20-IR301]WNS44550.1 N-acetylmuramoyl-L-alanine amidase family protein [Paenibacillus sp. MMS20-IR301]
MKRAGQRVLLLLLLPLLLLTFTGHEAAAAGSTAGRIVMDSKELALPKGVILENVNGSVMIPIRVVVENLGFEVLWEQTTRKVTVQQDGKSVQLAVGSKTAEADGVSLSLNAAPKQNGGTVLVPIRFVSEQFGLSVGWDNTDKTVYLSGGIPSQTPEPVTTDPLPSATPAPAAAVTVPAPSPLPEDNDSTEEHGGSIIATPAPVVTSPQVKGAVFSENRLIIAVAGGAKPTVTKVTGPDRIVVDFPGAAFASDFSGSFPGVSTGGSPQGKLDVSGYPQVTEIRYALFSNSPSTVRFVIQTAGPQNYQVSTDDSTGLITVDLNTVNNGTGTVVNPELNGRPVVVLDAGHGGTQPGAVSLTGKAEKAFNLAVILKAGAILAQEGWADVVYTRTDDATLDLKGRVAIAEAAKATLFISLHGNSLAAEYPNRDKVNGSETYYSRSESLPLAQIMQKHLVAGTGFKDNGVRSKSLHVTRETSMPAVLLEAGYLTNPGNEAAMYSEQMQDNLAREIVAGIREYLGL